MTRGDFVEKMNYALSCINVVQDILWQKSEPDNSINCGDVQLMNVLEIAEKLLDEIVEKTEEEGLEK